MRVSISHPTGNANVRAAATGLLNGGILSEFYTTVATFPGNLYDKLSALPGLSEFKRRQFNKELQPYTTTWPWYELGRFAASKSGLKDLIKAESGIFSVDSVYNNFDRHVADHLKKTHRNSTDLIYIYEDGALLSFIEAKRQGMKCLYDLPTCYWRTVRKIMDTERERWPDWTPTLTGLSDSQAKLTRKDEELKLADRIFVASSFVANSLKEFPGKLAPIEIIPYGFPPVFDSRKYSKITNRPLKLLYVGKLSQMKGIAELFTAVGNLGKHVQLTVVGHKISDNCEPLNKALAKHKWIPSLPHNEILKLMREHDILVFPSLLEGFGLVITEAMSQGTPVITTERTAGVDIINNSENGWLIDAGSIECLQGTIENILVKPELVSKVGFLAMKTAQERPWAVYQQELVTKIMTL